MESERIELRIVTEPKIYIVGRQQVDEESLAEFFDDQKIPWEANEIAVGPAGEALATIAGRTCYMSFANPRPGGNKAYLEHILQSRHGSVLEHAVWNIIFTGISRTLSHEMVRHRVGWGFSQLSQRYVDESNARMVLPPALGQPYADFNQGLEDGQPIPESVELFLSWNEAQENSLRSYRKLFGLLMNSATTSFPQVEQRKWARSAARSVLPGATETIVFATGNARAIRHMIELRSGLGADQEFRRLAVKLQELMEIEAPNLFGDYGIDGVGLLGTDHPKV